MMFASHEDGDNIDNEAVDDVDDNTIANNFNDNSNGDGDDDLYGDLIQQYDEKNNSVDRNDNDIDDQAGGSNPQSQLKTIEKHQNYNNASDNYLRKSDNSNDSDSLIASLRSEIVRLKREREILIKNMSCLYKTAKAEIMRKNDIIEEMRGKIVSQNNRTLNNNR